MSFQRKVWEDRIVETPNRRRLINVDTEEETVVDITREEGEVLAVGDRFDEANMNNLELRIKEGFDTLAKVASTGEYSDLKNTPTSLPANGGEAESVRGLGNADDIKEYINSQKAGENFIPAGYEEGDTPYFETPFHIRYKPKDGSVPEDTPMIAKYADNTDKISTSIIFEDSGMELFNVKIQPTDTKIYSQDMNNAGFITTFEDGSTIMGKANIVGGVFKGMTYSNGKNWNISFESGPLPWGN